MENNTFPKASLMTLKDMIEYSEGGIISKQVLKNRAGNITLFSFDEGQSLSEHTAPFDALLQVLEGRTEIRIDGKPFTLSQGESIILPAGIKHAVNAEKPSKMLLTMIKG